MRPPGHGACSQGSGGRPDCNALSRRLWHHRLNDFDGESQEGPAGEHAASRWYRSEPVLFDREEGTRRVVERIDRIAQSHPSDPIVFPELLIPGYPHG